MLFSTYVSVPEHVIHKIAMDIKEQFFEEMERDTMFEHLCKGTTMYDLCQLMNRVTNDYIQSQVPICEGHSLSEGVVKAIGDYLRAGKKIDGIKEFRAHTGCSLKEAKRVLDMFGTGPVGAIQFIAAFS